jgi:tubulin alpha
MYNGRVTNKEIHATIANLKVKETIKFVDWCPTGYKCGFQPPTFNP